MRHPEATWAVGVELDRPDRSVGLNLLMMSHIVGAGMDQVSFHEVLELQVERRAGHAESVDHDLGGAEEADLSYCVAVASNA